MSRMHKGVFRYRKRRRPSRRDVYVCIDTDSTFTFLRISNLSPVQRKALTMADDADPSSDEVLIAEVLLGIMTYEECLDLMHCYREDGIPAVDIERWAPHIIPERNIHQMHRVRNETDMLKISTMVFLSAVRVRTANYY